MEDPMPNSGSNTHQPHLSRGYPSPFHGNYEEPEPLPSATTLPYPYPSSPFRWSYLDGSISSLHNREDLGFTSVPLLEDEYQDDQWQSSNCRDWLSSCFQEEDATCGYGYGYSFQNEESGSEGYISYNYQQVENQSGIDFSPWSWTGAVEDYSYGYQRTEPGTTYRDSSDEITGLCESILGYWPCLIREYQKTYGGQ